MHSHVRVETSFRSTRIQFVSLRAHSNVVTDDAIVYSESYNMQQVGKVDRELIVVIYEGRVHLQRLDFPCSLFLRNAWESLIEARSRYCMLVDIAMRYCFLLMYDEQRALEVVSISYWNFMTFQATATGWILRRTSWYSFQQNEVKGRDAISSFGWTWQIVVRKLIKF